MSKANQTARPWVRKIVLGAVTLGIAGVGAAALIQMTLEDFHVPGTQVGDLNPTVLYDSSDCRTCHGDFDPLHEPARNWRGSLMAQAGRDPLFFAQLSTANQDVANVGYYCLRCHVPMSIVTGHANDATGLTLDALDEDGISCHFCHSLVDPVYAPGHPHEDLAILQGLVDPPTFVGNAMFVLDPLGRRRGPLLQPGAPHEALYSDYHKKAELCGACHDVGNVATTRQANGSYVYNAVNQRSPSSDPWTQFPLERTYTEWKLSAFNSPAGVDLQGRFGGENASTVSTCQDCHMPAQTARVCYFGPERSDMKLHQFAGAAASILDLIAVQETGNPEVDPEDLAHGRRAAISMLRRAASVGVRQSNGAVRVRVVNETGHKLPTGHIEGRRVWLGVRFYDVQGALLREYGSYDAANAVLDERSTRIYEMHVGLSPAAAAITGYPAGPTGHMSLADTIVKDNRIPPRGFTNAAFEAGGAPVVEHVYADGQYWDDAWFTVPPGAARVEVDVNYQNMPRHYVEELRDNNHTDGRGQQLFDLWNSNGKDRPIRMARAEIVLTPFLFGDVDGDCGVGRSDQALVLASFGRKWNEPGFEPRADLDGDHQIGVRDWILLSGLVGAHCP